MHANPPSISRPDGVPDDAQRRFDDLLAHLPAGVVMHDAAGRVVAANCQALALLGRREEQMLGAQSSDDTWHFVRADGSRMPPSEYPVNAVLRTGAKVSDLVVGVARPDHDDVRWAICNAYPERDERGAIDRVVVCFTDCTALKDAEQSLHKSEERMRLALQGSTDAPWDWDLVTGELYYSARYWDMLGYAPDEMRADPEAWVRLTHPEDRAWVAAFLEELLAGPRQAYSIEFRLCHRDGHYVPVLSRGFILRDGAGKALRLSGTNTDLTERKRVEHRIHELAYFDQLTGLPNRRFLIDELGQILARNGRAGRHGALLFLDLDNFKLLNDTMGHDVGDLLLREVARRLRQALREGDHLARLGGDEFVIVLENLGASPDEATIEVHAVGRKILDVLGEPFELAGRQCASSPSIGVTLFDGAPTSIDALLRQADLAMYRAKEEGRNTLRFFDPGMQAAADRQAALSAALRTGLARRQFVLYCQPQFGHDGSLVGAEALVRWQRGVDELVSPGEFIGAAESGGLIAALGLDVLEQGCHALARWARTPGLAPLKLAVNVSVHQLRDPDFPHAVAALLAATGAPADRLTLELTESVFARNPDDLVDRMQQLRRLGIHFALDDFGTGYSSLAYLARFPLAALKIDRSFVREVDHDPNASSIVEAIIALARKLHLETIAEGVELDAQHAFLAAHGCDVMQGYLLGHPVAMDEFERRYGVTGVTRAQAASGSST
ncbi:EAL domain-containing protein [Telluria mixta]|uniref:EAL domain-containing protein n=1 Tax=Telluria mixta TaxID=34071 RepID=A0ABT2BTG9_9BURK|nr:GGDEF and EAL domain-containing protein [Telluria mixta]MCS0628424.1 EAL domain-containing protein [Telluria mixta]WEM93469.1 EAL domain-containing protein [Telluria mixta]